MLCCCSYLQHTCGLSGPIFTEFAVTGDVSLGFRSPNNGDSPLALPEYRLSGGSTIVALPLGYVASKLYTWVQFALGTVHRRITGL
jgi:hypothetical protein